MVHGKLNSSWIQTNLFNRFVWIHGEFNFPCTTSKKLYEDSKTAKTTGLATWFQVSFPDMSDAFFVIAECGREIPMPEIAQNEAATMSISLIINTYKGLDTKIEPTAAAE